jgi:hypothetical protein
MVPWLYWRENRWDVVKGSGYIVAYTHSLPTKRTTRNKTSNLAFGPWLLCIIARYERLLATDWITQFYLISINFIFNINSNQDYFLKSGTISARDASSISGNVPENRGRMVTLGWVGWRASPDTVVVANKEGLTLPRFEYRSSLVSLLTAKLFLCYFFSKCDGWSRRLCPYCKPCAGKSTQSRVL